MAKLEFADQRRLHELFGSHDRNVKELESALGVSVSITASGVSIGGAEHDAELAGRVLSELYKVAGEGYDVSPDDVKRAVQILSRDSAASLREVFLEPFEVAVREAQVASVMTAYNLVNGSYCAENLTLVREILKGEWGFAGFVESDWGLGTRSTLPL